MNTNTAVRANKQKKPKKKKSTKGALIKGMSKRLPASILKNPSFEVGLKQIMKNYSGVYALYRRGQLYYVGLTKDLHGRMQGHLKDSHAGKWDSFVIFRIKRVNYLKDIETLLTHVAEPPGNKQKGHLPRDANLSQVVNETLKEVKKQAEEIQAALKK